MFQMVKIKKEDRFTENTSPSTLNQIIRHLFDNFGGISLVGSSILLRPAMGREVHRFNKFKSIINPTTSGDCKTHVFLRLSLYDEKFHNSLLYMRGTTQHE